MPRSYTVSYDIVSLESAEHGAYADSGYGIPGSLCCTSMDHVDQYPHGSDAWLREYDAARLAATDEVVPDEYDLEDHGGEESRAAVALVVRVLRDAGATEPSCGGYDGPGTGYTQVDGSTDYRTGEETRLSYHLEGWSDDEARAIYAAITGR